MVLDSDCDSLSRSVLVDARELVSELGDGVDMAPLGSGQLLGFPGPSIGWALRVCGCPAGVWLRMPLCWS